MAHRRRCVGPGADRSRHVGFHHTATRPHGAGTGFGTCRTVDRARAAGKRKRRKRSGNFAGSSQRGRRGFCADCPGREGPATALRWSASSEVSPRWLGRETSRARQAFQDVENAGRRGFANEDVDLANFCEHDEDAVRAWKIVCGKCTQLNRDSFEAFAILLLRHQKDVTQADADAAVSLLGRVIDGHPQGEIAWITDYKPLAQKILDDCRSYVVWKKKRRQP